MILFENTEIYGWKPAIRGMRNPKNSWYRSDTKFNNDGSFAENRLGDNDYQLMMQLANAGQVHGKFLRMITVTTDIIAPLYFYKELETYKIGTVCNSCSTMFKIADKEFEIDDFSHEHLQYSSMMLLKETVRILNEWRKLYLMDGKKKNDWWQMIQLLPSSYNQRRTYQFNYAVLKNIYKYRHAHKLDEWRDFCAWIKRLPYYELITGEI
jgi:hypothetical protein